MMKSHILDRVDWEDREDFFCDIRTHHSDNSDPGMSSAASCEGVLRVFCNSMPWQATRTLPLFYLSWVFVGVQSAKIALWE